MRFLIQGCHGYDDRPYRHEKSRQNTVGFFEFGRSEWIRTTDPLHPMQMRYQAAPHSVQQERNYNSTISAALAPSDNQISSQARIEASSARSELAPRRPLVVAGAGVVAGRLASRALRMRRTNSTS